MDLIGIAPQLNLYDENWAIYTYHPNSPPPKFVTTAPERCGSAIDSLICSGCIISGATIRHSLLGDRVRVESGSTIEDSILFPQISVGRNVHIRRAVIDKRITIPDGLKIGFDPTLDRSRGFRVTESGLTVIPKTIGM